MKKVFLAVMVLSAAIILILTGCSSSPSKYSAPTAASTSQYHQPSYSTVPPAGASNGKNHSGYLPPQNTVVPSTSNPGPMGTSAAPDSWGPARASSTNTIGLAAGGAKDITNFRENIRSGYLPQPADVTYEGLFYDYYFDTGGMEPTDKLYSPSYSYAVTRDPLSHQTEYYLSVGLNSGLKESDFQRKTLNLVIVLDNSGSMGEQYNQYYYDNYGNTVNANEEEGIHRLTKMASANEAVVSVLSQLNGDDRFAIITFNSSARLEKDMDYVNRVDMEQIKDDVRNIYPGGSTNLKAGLELASRQFNRLSGMNSGEYENRIMVLTDAQPNTGDFSSSGLNDLIEDNSGHRIYTTFIGIGVDFNADLVERIVSIKGANYYSVHSPRQFRERVEEEFDYMVTPLVFDLELNFESRGWRIEKVFGSPEADESTGNLMRINTLFASKSEGGEVRGGLVLLKLKKTSSASNAPVLLRTSYEDRSGRPDGDEQVIYLENAQPEYFDNNGIRKGVLLSRYAALLKNWMIDEREHVAWQNSWEPCVTEDSGICIPTEKFSQWERQSLPLTVNGAYHHIFSDFAGYFESEMRSIGDNDLELETEILNRLLRV
jgi:Ca-activated chloride channel homolog